MTGRASTVPAHPNLGLRLGLSEELLTMLDHNLDIAFQDCFLGGLDGDRGRHTLGQEAVEWILKGLVGLDFLALDLWWHMTKRFAA